MIIGFCGPAGAGKSTAAKHLGAAGFTRHPFAAPLKEMLLTFILGRGADAKEAFDLVDGPGKGQQTPWLNGATPRRAMQLLGTEWGRELSPTLWIDAWRDALPRGSVVCDDVRFPNEAAAIRELGGRVYRIRRPDLKLSAAVAKHASETQVFEVDGEIVNRDLTAFLDQIEALVA